MIKVSTTKVKTGKEIKIRSHPPDPSNPRSKSRHARISRRNVRAA